MSFHVMSSVYLASLFSGFTFGGICVNLGFVALSLHLPRNTTAFEKAKVKQVWAKTSIFAGGAPRLRSDALQSLLGLWEPGPLSAEMDWEESGNEGGFVRRSVNLGLNEGPFFSLCAVPVGFEGPPVAEFFAFVG